MLNEKSLKELIAECLEIEQNLISIESSNENIEEWDSLGHLSILSSLDEITGGKASEIEDLASALSFSELVNSLESAGLFESST